MFKSPVLETGGVEGCSASCEAWNADLQGALILNIVTRDIEQMGSSVRDNIDRHRFELERNGQLAFATYERRDSSLVIRHVEAAVPLRGTGAAGDLMQGVAEIARSEGLKITPLCGYAYAWIRRHREYHDLLN
jgi:predicted GNAT family acetyltransferase